MNVITNRSGNTVCVCMFHYSTEQAIEKALTFIENAWNNGNSKETNLQVIEIELKKVKAEFNRNSTMYHDRIYTYTFVVTKEE